MQRAAALPNGLPSGFKWGLSRALLGACAAGAAASGVVWLGASWLLSPLLLLAPWLYAGAELLFLGIASARCARSGRNATPFSTPP